MSGEDDLSNFKKCTSGPTNRTISHLETIVNESNYTCFELDNWNSNVKKLIGSYVTLIILGL